MEFADCGEEELWYASLLHAVKRDVNSFLDEIDHSLIKDSLNYLVSRWREKFGRRKEVLIIPRRKRAHDFEHVQCVSRELVFRVKCEVCDRRNFTCRAQSQRRCSKHGFAVRIDDCYDVVLFVLKYGLCRVGSLLCGSVGRGVPQGSPLSPSLAELILATLEEKNNKLFVISGKLMQTMMLCPLRWVDDIWIAVVGFIRASMSESVKSKLRSSFVSMASLWLDRIGLGLGIEDERVFAGHQVVWSEIFCVNQHFSGDLRFSRKYQNVYSYAP